jgi:hypothetical protein
MIGIGSTYMNKMTERRYYPVTIKKLSKIDAVGSVARDVASFRPVGEPLTSMRQHAVNPYLS